MRELIHEKLMNTSLTDLQIIEGLKNHNEKEIICKFEHCFFHRYKAMVFKGSLQRCKKFPDSMAMATDITQETFINALRKIKDFDLSREPDATKHGYIIKAWLGKIANNCFLKEYSKRKNVIYTNELNSKSEEASDDFFETVYGEEPIEIPNEFRTKLRQAMSLLTEVQKVVIETYAGDGCINSTKKLSPEKMKYLCQTFGTSSDNIRQIKKRALDKIKLHCS
jgi:RNA polymerase sigma factor (sigma-70 family)